MKTKKRHYYIYGAFVIKLSIDFIDATKTSFLFAIAIFGLSGTVSARTAIRTLTCAGNCRSYKCWHIGQADSKHKRSKSISAARIFLINNRLLNKIFVEQNL